MFGISSTRSTATRSASCGRVILLLAVTCLLAFSASSAMAQAPGVWGWGYNYDGELGNGSTINSNVPVTIAELPPLMAQPVGQALSRGPAISAGRMHTLALAADGTVWAWGDNAFGQLGNTTVGSRSAVPVRVMKDDGTWLQNITAIAAGDFHSLAVTADGKVWAWGANDYGQADGNYGQWIDDPTDNPDKGLQFQFYSPVWSPHQVKGASGEDDFVGAAAVAGGDFHSVVLRNDGSVWSWGSNGSGQLGTAIMGLNAYGSFWYLDSRWPVQVDLALAARPVKSIESGSYHTFAVLDDNSLWGWGSDYYGELGMGGNGVVGTPRAVSSIANVTCVSGGYDYSLVACADGSVYGMGSNWLGQLGDDSGVAALVPTRITSLDNVVFVSADTYHSAAIKSDGTVCSWGQNDCGQLGNGSQELRSTTPVRAVDPTDPTGYLTGVGIVSVGHGFTIAAKADETGDTTKPTIEAPADQLGVPTDAGRGFATLDPGWASASDNSGHVDVTWVRSDGKTNLTYTFEVGTCTITWTAKDAAGNEATDTQTIQVVDLEKPTITAPANITLPTDPGANSREVYETDLGTPSASDNGGPVTVTVAPTAGGTRPFSCKIGDTVMLWTATDAAGNTATAEQTVSVIDNEPPKLTAPTGITVVASPGASSKLISQADLGVPVVSDNSGDWVVSVAPKAGGALPFDCPTNATTIMQWTAKDAAGNVTTADQTVTVTHGLPIDAITVTPSVLWPVNHKMVSVTVAYTVTGASPELACTLNVACNQPIDGRGDGHTSSDWQVIDGHKLLLRAERSGGTDRIYTITITGPGVIPATCTVKVPRSKGK